MFNKPDRYHLCRSAILILTFFLLACNSKPEVYRKMNPEQKKTMVFIRVNHTTLPVELSFSGIVAPWKTEFIQSADSLQLISLLVGEKEKVTKGQLLGSFLNLEQSYEFTPVDFVAPFDGLVAGIYYQLDDRTKKNKPLFKIINEDYQLIRIDLEPDQKALLARGNEVTVFSSEKKMRTSIERIDPKTGVAEVLIPRRTSDFLIGDIITGTIVTNPVTGDFLLLRHLSGQPSRDFFIDPILTIDLRIIGVSDSLALVVPKIANIDSLGIL